MLNVSHVRDNMNCWHCGTELIWGGDHDIEDENDEYIMETNLSCPKCKKIMKHHLDKNNYKIHKKCHSCVIKFEHDLMVKDKTLKLYKNYKNNLKTKNTITSLNEIESYLLDAMNNTSNSSFVSEHGIIERWVGGRPKEENFEEVTKNIDKVKKEQKNQLKNEK